MFFFCCIGWFEEKLITLPDDVNFWNQFVINLLFFLKIVISKKFKLLLCSNSYVNCRFLWYKLKVLMTSFRCSFLYTNNCIIYVCSKKEGCNYVCFLMSLNTTFLSHPLQCQQIMAKSENSSVYQRFVYNIHCWKWKKYYYIKSVCIS